MIQLVPLVVLIPLAGAALALALPGRRRIQQGITLLVLTAVLVIGIAFMFLVHENGTLIMQVGGWAAPFGIALVIDSVSAILIAVSAVVVLADFLLSRGQGDR